MDISAQQTQVTSDDQELAKVLAGISEESDETNPDTPTDAGAPDLMTPPPLPSLSDSPAPVMPGADPVMPDTQDAPAAETPSFIPTPMPTPASAPAVADAPSGLADIKTTALNELKPLVDKLSLSPEEMFDAYLLLIRSTDDSTLISPAYASARAIEDEARKAKALLEIIKEIDYLSNKEA